VIFVVLCRVLKPRKSSSERTLEPSSSGSLLSFKLLFLFPLSLIFLGRLTSYLLSFRFSEQCAGAFAIAYVPIAEVDFFAHDPSEGTPSLSPVISSLYVVHSCIRHFLANSRVRHYLQQPDDVSGAKKTLADFLGRLLLITFHKIFIFVPWLADSCSAEGRTRTFTHLVQMVTDPQQGRIYQQVPKVPSPRFNRPGRNIHL